jgi:uncharacterized protein YndB with AHSA1/START domain
MPGGKTKTAGWEIGVSRTVPVGEEEVWALLTSPEGAAIWLGTGVAIPARPGDGYQTGDGTFGEWRSFRPLDRMRLTWRPPGWDHESTVQVTVRGDASGAKTVIRFHQERLLDADERERQRAHWSHVMDAVVAALGV